MFLLWFSFGYSGSQKNWLNKNTNNTLNQTVHKDNFNQSNLSVVHIVVDVWKGWQPPLDAIATLFTQCPSICVMGTRMNVSVYTCWVLCLLVVMSTPLKHLSIGSLKESPVISGHNVIVLIVLTSVLTSQDDINISGRYWLMKSPFCASQVKRSIFASPESVDGKVGVGTCGIADKPMTVYNDTSKFNVRHLMPQWPDLLCK